jgi:hypothetical protein
MTEKTSVKIFYNDYGFVVGNRGTVKFFKASTEIKGG